MNAQTKNLLVYAGMSAVVLVCIALVLHLGSNLAAPVSVGGKYSLQIAADAQAACPVLAGLGIEPVLIIEQSGQIIHAHFNLTGGTTFSGRLDGLDFAAQTRSGDLVLRGSIQRESEPDELRARLSGAACADDAAFSGLRQAASSSTSGGH